MPKFINTEIFVDPRKAFEIVGQELFGQQWQENWLNDSDAPEQREILHHLRTALKSGQVAAHWSTFDFQHSGNLTPQEVDQEFFRFNLKNNWAFHHSINAPVICKIHSKELLIFFNMQSGPKLPPTDLATKQCMQWLIEEFSNPAYSPPRTEELMRLAKAKFSRLSVRGYKTARRTAIAKTGRKDIGKAGRRKNQIGT